MCMSMGIRIRHVRVVSKISWREESGVWGRCQHTLGQKGLKSSVTVVGMERAYAGDREKQPQQDFQSHRKQVDKAEGLKKVLGL